MTTPEHHEAPGDSTLPYIKDIINTLSGEAAQHEITGAEMHESAGADIRSQCAQTLAGEYDALHAQLAASGVGRFEAGAAQRAEVQLIREAIAAGDQEALDALVEKVTARRNFPDADADEVTPGYVIAALAGHRRAQDLLHGELALEEAAMAREFPSERWLDPDYSPVLRSVTEACAAAGVPADVFIHQYTRNGMRQWGAYMGYLMSIAEYPDFPAEERRKAEQTVAHLMSSELKYSRVNGLAPPFFSHMTEPETQKELMGAYIDSLYPTLQSGNISDYWVVGLERMYGILVQKPHLTDRPEILELLPDILDRAYNALGGPGNRRWVVDQIVARDGSPNEVIERLDLLIGERAAAGKGSSITFDRDSLLGEYAAHYAEKGDFERAKRYMDAIGTTADYNAAAMACLKHAHNEQDAAMLQPDETALLVSPARNIPFKLNEARRSGDAQAFADAVVSVAKDAAEPQEPKAKDFTSALMNHLVGGLAGEIIQDALNETSSEYRRDGVLKDAFYETKQQDPVQALKLARRVLGVLRQGPPERNGAIIDVLSNEAVHMGDKEEFERRYRAAEAMEPGAGRARELAFLLRIAPDR
jgi:hypothetical protein